MPCVAVQSVTLTAGVAGAFSQHVIRFATCPTIVVVSYWVGPDIDAHFDAFEAAYRAAYAAHEQLILVFDARNLGCIPRAATRERMLALTASLKWQTTFKVPFVGVLVPNELFARFITELLKARGQAAPLVLTHSVHELARDVMRAVVFGAGRAIAERPTGHTLATAGYNAVFASTFVLYLKFLRHHVRIPGMRCA